MFFSLPLFLSLLNLPLYLSTFLALFQKTLQCIELKVQYEVIILIQQLCSHKDERERDRESDKRKVGEREKKHFVEAISRRGAQTAPDCHAHCLMNAFEIEVTAGVPIWVIENKPSLIPEVCSPDSPSSTYGHTTPGPPSPPPHSLFLIELTFPCRQTRELLYLRTTVYSPRYTEHVIQSCFYYT